MRRLLIIAAILLGFSSLAHAQGASFEKTIITNTGRPVAGALVTICMHSPTAPNPCTALATIYGNVELTGGPIANPTPADGFGNVLVFVTPGTYDYTVQGTGIITTTYKGVTFGSSGGSFTGSLASTQLAFGNGTNTITGNPNLFFTSGTSTLSIKGFLEFLGSTSGSAKLGAAAVAGTPCPLTLPTVSPTVGQILTAGTPGATCPTAWGTFANGTIIAASLTTSFGFTDIVSMPGVTVASHCVLTATNLAAATHIAQIYISNKAANQITVTRNTSAAPGDTYDIICTSN